MAKRSESGTAVAVEAHEHAGAPSSPGMISQDAAIELVGGADLLAGIVAARLCERSKISGRMLYAARDLRRVLNDDLELQHAKRLAPTAPPLPQAPSMMNAGTCDSDATLLERCPNARRISIVEELRLAPFVPPATADRMRRLMPLMQKPGFVALVALLERGLDALADEHAQPRWLDSERAHIAAALRAEGERVEREAERDAAEVDDRAVREARRDRLDWARRLHPDDATRRKLWNAAGPERRAEHFCPRCGANAVEAPWQKAPPGVDGAAINRPRAVVHLACAECAHRFATALSECTPGDTAPDVRPTPYRPGADRGELLTLLEAARRVGVSAATVEGAGRGGAFELVKIRGELFAYEHEVETWAQRAVQPARR